jgi:hypothetical protein
MRADIVQTLKERLLFALIDNIISVDTWLFMRTEYEKTIWTYINLN